MSRNWFLYLNMQVIWMEVRDLKYMPLIWYLKILDPYILTLTIKFLFFIYKLLLYEPFRHLMLDSSLLQVEFTAPMHMISKGFFPFHFLLTFSLMCLEFWGFEREKEMIVAGHGREPLNAKAFPS